MYKILINYLTTNKIQRSKSNMLIYYLLSYGILNTNYGSDQVAAKNESSLGIKSINLQV